MTGVVNITETIHRVLGKRQDSKVAQGSLKGQLLA